MGLLQTGKGGQFSPPGAEAERGRRSTTANVVDRLWMDDSALRINPGRSVWKKDAELQTPWEATRMVEPWNSGELDSDLVRYSTRGVETRRDTFKPSHCVASTKSTYRTRGMAMSFVPSYPGTLYLAKLS